MAADDTTSDLLPLTPEFIRRHGGIRPMAASEDIYVFGKWKSGNYPIEVTRRRREVGIVSKWELRLFGFACLDEPNGKGLVRLLALIDTAVESEKK